MRHATKIGCDTRGMLRHALAVLIGAAAAAVIVACSTPAVAGKPTATMTKSAETSVATTSSAPVPSGATIDACRSLATDESLAEFWHEVANSPTVSGLLAMLAGHAVMNLGRYTAPPNPDLDPNVLLTMTDSVDQMGDMNQEIAGGAPFDIERFRGIITPVVTVCEDAGVDMTVPE